MTEITLNRGDAQLRGTATGTGPTVLLLHAGGEERSVWAPVAAELSQHNLRTVAFDLRGHGISSGQADKLQPIAADVTAMIHAEPPPVIVVGASLGGFAAIAALATPSTAHQVAGLILVDVVPNPDPGIVRAWLTRHGLRDTRTALVEDIFNQSHDLLATTAALDLPILLIRGGPTSPLADPEVHRLQALVPTLAVTQVPHAGHLIAHDAPDDLARLITRQASSWLAAVGRGGSTGITGSGR